MKAVKAIVRIAALALTALLALLPPGSAEGLLGGWAITESPEVTVEARAALEEAMAALAGTAAEPVALLGTQLVSGTNYCLLCRVTDGDAPAKYDLVYVYAPLDRPAELMGFGGIDISSGPDYDWAFDD